jgi:hypothetical protein
VGCDDDIFSNFFSMQISNPNGIVVEFLFMDKLNKMTSYFKVTLKTPLKKDSSLLQPITNKPFEKHLLEINY